MSPKVATYINIGDFDPAKWRHPVAAGSEAVNEGPAFREQIYHDLRYAFPTWDNHAAFKAIYDGEDFVWLHFTDWYGFFDLERLIEQCLLAPSQKIQYAKHNNHMDYFPPTPYELTPMGRAILDNPRGWIIDGLVSTEAPKPQNKYELTAYGRRRYGL